MKTNRKQKKTKNVETLKVKKTGESRAEFKADVDDFLHTKYHTTFEEAGINAMYKAVASVINQQLLEKSWDFNKNCRKAQQEDNDKKKIYYISMEFLMGQSLKNNLYNLGMTDCVKEIVKERGFTLDELFACEPDAGLGNGGLGRLAACYLDSLAAGGYDTTGFSICYQYGLFKQKLIDGWQAEMPDNWLPGGSVWLNRREEETFRVGFYGEYNEYWDESGMHFALENQEVVDAVPYDMYVSGADNDAVAKLRLWKAESEEGFDMASFNNGDFTGAAQKNNRAELISKVLYPADNLAEGKQLRLKQQYFMVSASCQNIVKEHCMLHGSLDNFHEKVCIHINDTHPALCVPELMRIFVDEYGCDWDYAWYRVKNSLSYTNHTVLSEALEKWNIDMVRMLLPRIYVLIGEINRRFREDMEKVFPGDEAKISYMAPIGDGQVRMANLSIIGSHMVNGVSGLHSEILKDDLFHDFALANPDMFTNVTNGIAYRRWLCQSNPKLAALLDETIGDAYRHDPLKLADFMSFKNDASVVKQLDVIKKSNKEVFSNKIAESGIAAPDPDSIFIVQAKRLHEYKRQLLNALRIITRYQQLKENPDMEMRPETYLFAAKTAPNYYTAKTVIQLIWAIGQEIEKDPKISKKLRVIFLENYSVSMAESLMPATEISEQISLAGKEASGTGNMKMMINGAVTIGTMDGANVEMYEHVGKDNIYIFGQSAEEVGENLRNGYDSHRFYEGNRALKDAVDSLKVGYAGKSFEEIYQYLLNPTYSIADPYMCLYDFEDYCRAHNDALSDYENRTLWGEKEVVNIAMASFFGADRSVREYAENIWNTKPVL